MQKSGFAVLVLLSSLIALSAGIAQAQDYPNKPVRILTGPAGGGSDFASRILAQGVGASMGQPMVVDNRIFLIAVEAAAKAPPDGYTILVGGAGMWISPFLQKVSYDVARDFAPITLLVREVSVLAVNPALPVTSVKELIALAKAKPGSLNYASASIGGTPHLAAELFKSLAGVNIVHVAYKGNAQAITAVLSNEAQLLFLDMGLLAPHIKSGKLRALAVTSATPSTLVPELPTMAAAGVPGYEAVSMTGLFAPAKTPRELVNKINRETVRLLNSPDVKEKFLSAGVETVGNTPEQFADLVKSDMAKVGKVVKDAGITVN